jgi:hypothetical protein
MLWSDVWNQFLLLLNTDFIAGYVISLLALAMVPLIVRKVRQSVKG